MTDLALIPPFAALRYTLYTRTQLMLPHLIGNLGYDAQYRTLCGNRNQYVILDNGANENAMPNDEALLKFANRFAVDEVVIPDVMEDAEGTIWRGNQFLDTAKRNAPLFPVSAAANYGVVLNGKTYDDAMRVFDAFDVGQSDWVTTVFIPRSLCKNIEPIARIEVARRLYERWLQGNFDIHFLGASSLWPEEFKVVNEEVPFVRSMDTSMPFVYALEGRYLLEADKPLDRKQDTYFEAQMLPSIHLIANRNINKMLSWIRR